MLNVLLVLFAVYGLAMTAGVVSERSGIVNIGLNANIIAGALGSLIVHGLLKLGGPTASFDDTSFGVDFLGLLIAGLSGVIISWLFSIATITLKGDHVIVGTALNLLLPTISFIVFIFDKSNIFTSGDYDNKNGLIQLSRATSGEFDWRNIIYFFIAILLIGATWFGIRFTRIGLRLWASGENPHALASAGVNVHRVRYIAQIIVGFLSGVAGAIFLKSTKGVFSGDVGGIGFIAIAIIVISQWRIHWGVLATFVFVTIQAALTAYNIDIVKQVGPGASYFMEAVPFIIPIIVLPFFRKISNMPKHDGLIYDASQR